MVLNLRNAVCVCSCFAALRLCEAQSLSPRAYVIVPVHSNAVTLTYSLSVGGVVFNDTIPVTDSSGRIGTEIFSYFHSFDCFGRSANVTAILPYAVGHFQGDVDGVHEELYRSGLAAVAVRVSVNLLGARAMNLKEYSRWKQRTVLGASVIVQTPTGQYDGTRLINIGEHRWSFKPEIGFSQRHGKWLVDAYGAVWFFTQNDNFFSNAPGSTGPNRQTQEPMGAVEAHLSYDIKPRLWASLDGNYWYGGKTSLNGVQAPTTLQANSRIGVTAAVPITKHQSLKFSYSRGTYVTFGGNFQNVSAAWQYSWFGRPQ
jgi:Putative MetA-pathway of phenol degradation